MKTVSVAVSERFTALTSTEMFAFFSTFICYDGMIDTHHSWYGGLITGTVDDSEIIFTHDMPNGEWDSWYKTALRLLEENSYLPDGDDKMHGSPE